MLGCMLGNVGRGSAVFAANDMMALGCLFALNHAGIQAPRDIAIAGFDDIFGADFTTPQLTTVRAPLTEMGEQALHALQVLVDGAVSAFAWAIDWFASASQRVER